MVIAVNSLGRFNDITRLISKLEYSYRLTRDGYDISFDEKLDRNSFSSEAGLTMQQITEQITPEELHNALNNSLNASGGFIDRNVRNLRNLINSFDWEHSPEGADYWGNVYDKVCE